MCAMPSDTPPSATPHAPRWPKQHPGERIFNAVVPAILGHRPEKKIHDVAAVIAHLDPGLFQWVLGRPFTRLTRDGRRLWGTKLAEDGDHVAIGVDLERFWDFYLMPPRVGAVVQSSCCDKAAA